MPSRNSINKPKLTAPKVRRAGPKGKKIAGTELTTDHALPVTTKVISKKRAKKNARNAKYVANNMKNRLEAIQGDIMMQDLQNEETMSATQKKIRLRNQKILEANAIKIALASDLPEDELQLSSSGNGTTLGRNPRA
ncbi:hypothetical protein TRVA0_057S00386 [Trichomonascus vanleenenianus]|uniref:Alb1p n=1 Tax=Trichomonascus vanleenenianus TaxID=2268995 RepID=UPI003ECA0890